jgi:hypothetical protein
MTTDTAKAMERARELVALVKAGGDPELYRRAVDLEADVIELVRASRRFEFENEELRDTLSFKGKLTFRAPLWYAADDPVPYCPICWETQRKAIHVDGPMNVAAGTRYDCLSCKNTFIANRRER